MIDHDLVRTLRGQVADRLNELGASIAVFRDI